MLVRIVKLSFFEEHIHEFLTDFETNKLKIRHFNGCQFLELYRDKEHTNVFFTYSYWDSEADLNTYRNSEFFKTLWNKTKVLFNAKPEAWSVNKLESLN